MPKRRKFVTWPDGRSGCADVQAIAVICPTKTWLRKILAPLTCRPWSVRTGNG